MTHPFYRLRAPKVWATDIDALSVSSLSACERCPRQWQLSRSTWEGLTRFPTRPAAASLEGTIVHEALDRLFRALTLAGLPEIKSPAFAAVMRATDVLGFLRLAITDADATLADHPRRASLRLPHDALTLYNRVVVLFRQSYAQVDRRAAPRIEAAPRPLPGEGDALTLLRKRGALTEWPVRHPTLPFRGVIDLVQRTSEGTRLVDFKTGAVRPEHEEQLLAYALMWWRVTGDVPVAIAVQRPDGATGFAVDPARLASFETALTARVAAAQEAVTHTPAFARAGDHCARCDVRAFCDEYWEQRVPSASGGGWSDVTLEVPLEVGDHGFVAMLGGRQTPVVWSDEHGPFEPGARLRILGARIDKGTVHIERTTEVFVR